MKTYLVSFAVLFLFVNIASAQDPGSDTFERHDLGPSWSIPFGAGSVGIIDNRDVGLRNGPSLFGILNWNTSFSADQYSMAVIADSRIDSMLTQVYVRRRSSDFARYAFHWDDRTSAWQIKFDGVPTAQTRILAQILSAEPMPGDTLRIEARGRTLIGFHNGTEVIRAIDSAAGALVDGGNAGMAFRFTIGFPAAYPSATFASWKGGSITSIDTTVGNVSIMVDNNRVFQRMEGFGATTLSLVYGANDFLTQTQRASAIDAVYGQVKLTMGQLEPGIMESPADATDLWNQRRNDNDDPFSDNASGFNWTSSDAMKTKVVDLAAPLGFDNFSLGYKLTTTGALNFLEPYRTTDYQRYLNECAEHIVVGLMHWRDVYGIVPRWVMPWNEPTSGNREIAGATTQTLVDLVKRIGNRMRAEGFSTVGLIVPGEETVQRSFDVASAMLADPEARKYIGAIAYHAYPYESPYSSTRQILEQSGKGQPIASQIAVRGRLRDLGEQYGVPLWLSEISEGPGNNDYPYGAFENLIARAIHIHDEFVYTNASAYYGMLAMWDRRSHDEHFAGRDIDFYSETTSIALIDGDTTVISGMGYAIGHYARWIPRGSVRVDATSSDSLVQITAFRDSEASRMVFVLINNATATRTVSMRVNSASLSGQPIGEQSTVSKRWGKVDGTILSDSSTITLTLPATSVTTLAASLRQTVSPVSEESATAVQLSLKAFPSLGEGPLRVRYEISEYSDVKFSVVNILGDRVMAFDEGFVTPGLHENILSTSTLPAGSYYLVLKSAGQSRCQAFVVVR